MDSGRTRHRRRVLLTAIKPTGLLQRQTASRGAVCFLCLPRYGQFCGGAQAWDAAGYERNARFVSDLGAEVLDLLAPKPDETILDIGCGDGALTERIAASGRACEHFPVVGYVVVCATLTAMFTTWKVKHGIERRAATAQPAAA